MCQARAKGGRRCAAHTRVGFRRAVDEVLSAYTKASCRAAREAGQAAVVAHAITPTGRAEVEAEAERVFHARRRYVDGGLAAQWLLWAAYEADEERARSAAGLPSDAQGAAC